MLNMSLITIQAYWFPPPFPDNGKRKPFVEFACADCPLLLRFFCFLNQDIVVSVDVSLLQSKIVCSSKFLSVSGLVADVTSLLVDEIVFVVGFAVFVVLGFVAPAAEFVTVQRRLV